MHCKNEYDCIFFFMVPLFSIKNIRTAVAILKGRSLSNWEIVDYEAKVSISNRLTIKDKMASGQR